MIQGWVNWNPNPKVHAYGTTIHRPGGDVVLGLCRVTVRDAVGVFRAGALDACTVCSTFVEAGMTWDDVKDRRTELAAGAIVCRRETVTEKAESVAPEPWSEMKVLQQEIKWAHEALDRYGAPRKHYNPYEGEEFDLNLAGRISVWLDPKNEGGWTVNNPEVAALIDGSVASEPT